MGLATILGVVYAIPEAQTNTPHQVGAMISGLQQNNVMGKSVGNIISNMRMVSPYQAQAGPRQYHLQDEFGNFEYAYANKDSEKMEKGNDVSVRGRYAYIMSNGVLRRVDYIADNNGFHVLQDNADKSRSQERIKRSVEPDLPQARMTSFMDSSSFRDNAMVTPNVYNIMRQDMPNNIIQRNRMNQMSSQHNMHDLIDRSSNLRENNMMGHNRMGQHMYSNMMGRDMSSNTMNRNMISQDNMRNVMGQDMIEENIKVHNMDQNTYSNMMGQDMLNRNMMGQEMSSNMMGRDMSSNMMKTYVNDVNRLPLGQRNTISQRMQIEQIPQSVALRSTI